MTSLALDARKAKSNDLKLFFSFFFKTHKPGLPFMTTASEWGTWQLVLSNYFQKHLLSLQLENPFLLRNSDTVVLGFRELFLDHRP